MQRYNHGIENADDFQELQHPPQGIPISLHPSRYLCLPSHQRPAVEDNPVEPPRAAESRRLLHSERQALEVRADCLRPLSQDGRARAMRARLPAEPCLRTDRYRKSQPYLDSTGYAAWEASGLVRRVTAASVLGSEAQPLGGREL